ncbi:FecR family protein [Govanella unica]|uniref:FecR family protein n=1 Tax=Govanella unica TaxID=2975056 RepID=A0A9X3TXN9_9PROT|nr:FecR family protein [Govania unica]
MSGPKSIPQTAEEWCARMHSGQVTGADRTAFADWMDGAPENRSEYDATQKLMQLSRGLGGYPDLGAALGLEQSRTWRIQPALIAASVAAALMIGGVGIWWQYRVIDYATLVGEQKTVTLADGSVVDLNTDTTLDVAIGGSKRQLVLEKGEAFFVVSPDKARPFVIKTAQGEIRVVGTKFNVRTDGEAMVVTVLEGHVRVARGQEAPFDLVADDQLRLDATGAVQKKSGADLAQVAAWRRGQVYFDNASLAEVIGEFNRYSAQKYVLHNKKLAQLKLSGVFRTGDPNALLYALSESFGIVVEVRSAEAVYLGLPRTRL